MGRARVHARAGGAGGKSLEGLAREEAELARELGVTVRELRGWAPRSVTLDADGNVLSVTVAEPRFTPRERILLLASRRIEKTPIGRHGLPIAVATDKANQFKFKVPPPVTDWAQKKINAVQKQYEKDYPNADTDALRWRVELDD